MNRRYRFILLISLILLQIILNRYITDLKISLDLLYLILVYYAIKSGFIKTMIMATIIGLVTDFFSMNILGIFGFSRIIIAYLLNNSASHFDLKNNLFVFLLIAISLFTSNFIANTFLFFIANFPFDLNLLMVQPVLTALVGIFILSTSKTRQYLDVY